MKKSHLIILFLFLSSKSFCQKLTQVNIDKQVSLLLPENYTIKDTLGFKVYSANRDNGFVVVNISQDVKGKIAGEKKMHDFLKKFQKGMLEQVEGRLISESFIKIDSTEINKFTFLTNFSNLIQWNVHALRIDNKTYSINFVYKEETTEITTEKEVINSLKFSN